MANTNKKLLLARRGQPDLGRDDVAALVVPSNGKGLFFDNFGNPYIKHLLDSFSYFELLPVITTVVATSEKLALLVGTNAVSADATVSDTGGVNLGTHGAQNDSTAVAAVAATGWVVKLSATNVPVFRTRVNLTSIASVLVSAGLNGTRAAADIDPTNAAGEGACFVFDPTKAITWPVGTIPTGAENNWILAMKVAGADTFIDSGVPVVAARDYDLRIEIGTDLKPVYFIDEVKVGTGAAAVTAAQSTGVIVGIKALVAAVKNLHVRFVGLSRAIG